MPHTPHAAPPGKPCRPLAFFAVRRPARPRALTRTVTARQRRATSHSRVHMALRSTPCCDWVVVARGRRHRLFHFSVEGCGRARTRALMVRQACCVRTGGVRAASARTHTTPHPAPHQGQTSSPRLPGSHPWRRPVDRRASADKTRTLALTIVLASPTHRPHTQRPRPPVRPRASTTSARWPPWWLWALP